VENACLLWHLDKDEAAAHSLTGLLTGRGPTGSDPDPDTVPVAVAVLVPFPLPDPQADSGAGFTL